jgi:hypothetical protein
LEATLEAFGNVDGQTDGWTDGIYTWRIKGTNGMVFV